MKFNKVFFFNLANPDNLSIVYLKINEKSILYDIIDVAWQQLAMVKLAMAIITTCQFINTSDPIALYIKRMDIEK